MRTDTKQVGGRDTKSLGDGVEAPHRGVASTPALEEPDRVRVDAGLEGQLSGGQVALIPQRANQRADGDEVDFRHDAQVTLHCERSQELSTMRAVAPDLTVQYALGVATELVRTVGRNLRRLRGNMPREDLAERAGVHPNTIYLLESEGAKDLKFSTIEALAPALGVTFEDLVLGEPATPEQVQQSFEAFRASGLAPDLRPEEERDLLRDPVLRFGAPPPAAWFYTLQRLRVMRAPSEGR